MSDPVEDTDFLNDPEPRLSHLNNKVEISNAIESTRIQAQTRENDGLSSSPLAATAGKTSDHPPWIPGYVAGVAEDSRSNGPSCQDVTVEVTAPKSGEKKVGTLLAAAMKKYVVPRSSSYHGVTKLKWSGKFEAHLWDNTSQVEGRKRKGKHVYLGSYDSEEKAARAHDLAALKYWGPTPSAKLNFPVSDYEKELETMKNMTHEEYVALVRRHSSCFSRGASAYRGVTRR